MWKGAVVFISALAAISAFTYIAPLEPKPEKYKDQPVCYISALDRVIPELKYGSRAPQSDSEMCLQYNCRKDKVQVFGCGVVSAQAPCKTIVQRDKPYPDCCPQIICPITKN